MRKQEGKTDENPKRLDPSISIRVRDAARSFDAEARDLSDDLESTTNDRSQYRTRRRGSESRIGPGKQVDNSP